MPVVEHINALEPEFIKLSDDELRNKTEEFKKILATRPTSNDIKKDRELEKQALDSILLEAFATVRVCRLGLTNFIFTGICLVIIIINSILRCIIS